MNLGTFAPGVDFTGCTVIMTGGTGVLGHVLVRALVDTGANLALIVRDAEKALALFPPDVAPRERFLVMAANVTDAEALRHARAQCLDRFTRIDALVNGAGGNRPEATTSKEHSFFDLDASALREVVELNLLGTILPSQIFAEPMANRGKA